MNELLTELLAMLDQNVIHIQPYTLDDSQRPEIQARIDDWIRRARLDLERNDEVIRAALQPFADFLEAFERRPISNLDAEQIYAIHGGKYVNGGAYLGWEHLQAARAALSAIQSPTADPQHCYLCDRPKLDCACTLEESESPA